MTLQRSTQHERHDLYFRSADRLRAAGCANALSREGLSVVMSCEREALLDHYVEMTLQEVKKTNPDCLVEAYFPESTESLMARFNDILSRSTVQEALKPGALEMPLRIWVIHDAPDVPAQELQLLARLIHNFPGAKVRAQLLSTQREAQEGLTVFGRRLLRWDIDLPTAAQVEAALENARFEGRERSVRQLLSVSGLLSIEGTSQAVAASSMSAQAIAQAHGLDHEPMLEPQSRKLAELAQELAAPNACAPQTPPASGLRARIVQSLASRLPAGLRPRLKMAQKLPTWAARIGKKTPSMPWPAFKLRKPSDRLQGALVVGLALMALSTVLTFWMQPESFKSSTSATQKPTRAAVTAGHGPSLRPVSMRMDAI